MITYEWDISHFEDDVKEDILRTVNYILAYFNKPDMDVEIMIVNDDVVRMLNSSYRGIDKTTDVLSFPNYGEELRDIDHGFLGSITISHPKAMAQAKEYGHSFRREICYLCAHGMLHLFGYDHIEKKDEEIMTALASRFMSALQINRVE